MKFFSVNASKKHFSKLVNMVMQGHEILIAMAGKPVAKLGPISPKPKRQFGVLKGKIKIGKDFDDPLPADLLAEFEK